MVKDFDKRMKGFIRGYKTVQDRKLEDIDKKVGVIRSSCRNRITKPIVQVISFFIQ